MIRVLVTGAKGMLGSAVVKTLSKDGALDVRSLTHRNDIGHDEKTVHADLTSRNATRDMLEKVQPEIIIHCAAEVDVNKCEREPEYADALHVLATRQLAKWQSVKQFIYISTDSVFDGQQGNYTESDITNPLNHYGKSKLAGEAEALASTGAGIVLRTNLLGFHSPIGKSLFEWGYQSLADKFRINGFENVYFNPLNTNNLAIIILKIIEQNLGKGIYHVGTKTSLSKYSFLTMIASFFHFDKELITPVTAEAEFAGRALRPLNTTLNTSLIESCGIEMPSLSSNLSDLFESYKIHLNVN